MVSEKQTSKKLKIVVELSFGPFKSANDVVLMKRKIKAKVPKIIFSSTVKTSRGYTSRGKLSYLKTTDASPSVVRQILQARLPGAKVSVTKV